MDKTKNTKEGNFDEVKVPNQLDYPMFTAGKSKATVFSAKLMNRIIRFINKFANLTEGPGISIDKRADANVVIGIKKDVLDKINNPPLPNQSPGSFVSPSSGSLNFKGQWQNATNYVTNDIVYRLTSSEIVTGKASSYVAITSSFNNEPPAAGLGEVSSSNAYWKVFVPYSFPFMRWMSPTSASTNYTQINSGSMEMKMGSFGSYYINPNDIPVAARGKEFRFRELLVCDGGSNKTICVVCTEPY